MTITHLAAAIAGSVISFRTSRVDASPARTAAAASTGHGDRTAVLSRPAGRASKSPEQLASLWKLRGTPTLRDRRWASRSASLQTVFPLRDRRCVRKILLRDRRFTSRSKKAFRTFFEITGWPCA